MEPLTRGGIYLARLDPAKGAEIGKLRPVAILTAQDLLDVDPLLVFVCPLSSRSDPAFTPLHIELRPRDRLEAPSFGLVEHCRGISRSRVLSDRIAQLNDSELALVLHRLQRLVGL